MSSEIFEKYGNDPLTLCRQWLVEAQGEPSDPEAACLATAGADGKPSARMVLVKEIAENGFKFHTSSLSAKGRDMAENPQAALCFYWKSTRRQIRVEGRVEAGTKEEADAYFKTRPRERQIGAWASRQSETFEKWEELEKAVGKYETQFSARDIPRPPHWSAYRLRPGRIEFWIAHPHRLHERFVYERRNGGWQASWLFP